MSAGGSGVPMLTGPEIARRLGGEWSGQSGMCPCPICQPEKRRDQRALSVTLRGERLLLKCHKSSCAYVEIVRAAGVETERTHTKSEEASKREAEERNFREAKAARAAIRAEQVVHAAKPMAGHPYMITKGFWRQPVPCLTLRNLTRIIRKPKIFEGLSEDVPIICIGLYEASELTLQSLQMIAPDGTKCFLYGGSTKGAAAILGLETLGSKQQGASVRIVCEGYATGMSAFFAANHEQLKDVTIYCAMTAGNMVETARRASCHGVIADNDASGTGRKAALATKLPFAMPKITDTDFNDFWKANPLGARQTINRLYAETQRRKEKL